MRRAIILGFLIWLLSVAIISCSNVGDRGAREEEPIKRTSAPDTSFLADKNFPIKNMRQTLSFWAGHKFYKENLYLDSTHKVRFIELTKQQKSKLMVPFIAKELGVKDVSTVENYMQAFFIAKQNKTEDLQPIVLYVVGDDCASLTLIVLDKDRQAVSGFNLCGGLDAGPYSTGDSLTTYEAKSYSSLDKNQIITCRIINSDFADSLKKPSVVDSNVFKSVINKSGKIITAQVVKARYRGPYKPHSN